MGFRSPQTIRRKKIGYVNDDGYYVAGGYAEITIMGSVQPLNHSENAQYTAMQPQGARTANILKVYTDEEIYPNKQATGGNDEFEADVLLWHGRLWRCIDCDCFQSGVISHYRGIFQEIDADTGQEGENDHAGEPEEISP